MHRHLNDLPITGKSSTGDLQATVDELSDLIMPVINHSVVTELGFSVDYLPMDSDPETYEVRKIWVRTIHDGSREPSQLGLWATKHPTLGSVLFGEMSTDLGRGIDSLWNALRDSRYRDAVLSVFGSRGGDVTVSSESITVRNDFDPFDVDWR